MTSLNRGLAACDGVAAAASTAAITTVRARVFIVHGGKSGVASRDERSRDGHGATEPRLEPEVDGKTKEKKSFLA